jgi:uncharacterized membrane-anchored protein YhcB (DUF1043 family)
MVGYFALGLIIGFIVGFVFAWIYKSSTIKALQDALDKAKKVIE